ncbi:MAG: DUF4105 domain-containing protein, partial [Myxococcota bacterium]
MRISLRCLFWLALFCTRSMFNPSHAAPPDKRSNPWRHQHWKLRLPPAAVPQKAAAQPSTNSSKNPSFKDKASKQPTTQQNPSSTMPSARIENTRPAQPTAPRMFRQRTHPERYEVYLVTIGPGDWLFTYFGHNALRIIDRTSGMDAIFNFGTFSMARPWILIRNYLKNRAQYSLSLWSRSLTRRVYRRANRTYHESRLFLSQDKAKQLVHALSQHYLPQNREYTYDHYRSNCSTKIRDILLPILGRAFRQESLAFTHQTYRTLITHTVRPNPVLMYLMDFGMGPFADFPLRTWDKLFLPQELEDYMRSTKLTQRYGRTLLGPRKTYFKRTQPPPGPLSTSNLTYALTLFCTFLGLILWNRSWFRWWLR